MSETNQTSRETEKRTVRRMASALVVIIVALSLMTAPAAAGSEPITLTDDFEDGDSEGWEGPNQTVVNNSTQGTYSLEQDDGYGGSPTPIRWTDGPTLDLSKEFTLNGTSYHDLGSENYGNRIGLINKNATGAMLVFSAQSNSTYLTDKATNFDPGNASQISTTFDETWFHWKIHSPGNGTLQAKVWEVGQSEPSTFQIQEEFNESTSAPMAMGAGYIEDGRYIRLDSVSVTGTPVTDPGLKIETRSLVQPGDTHPYKVIEVRNVSGTLKTFDVTENATLVSLNESLVRVNQSGHTITGTSDPVAAVTYLKATYNNTTTHKSVTVAKPKLEHLEIVPGIWRAVAIGSDETLFALLIATLLAVPAARFTSAFGGLAVAQMVIVVGWFGGYVGFGMAAVSLFIALFIGLNLAANINYQAGSLGRR